MYIFVCVCVLHLSKDVHMLCILIIEKNANFWFNGLITHLLAQMNNYRMNM